MKKNNRFIPAGHWYTIQKQVCNLIPGHMVSNLAKEHGVDTQSRTFSPWSHVVSLVHAQLTHAMGLNDVCDSLQMHRDALSTIRGATPPSRNTLSHANKIRSSSMAETLYWRVMEHLMTQSPGFAKGRVRRGYLRRFRTAIHAVDSTTIHLVANCMDWAKHRRRKAAAKCHMRLNLQSFLPQCAIIATARETDNHHAPALCMALQAGEIAIFDKAYIDFRHLGAMASRGVHWVTRAKSNLKYRSLQELRGPSHGRILRDEIIELSDWHTRKGCEHPLRRIEAMVEIKGRDIRLVFLTNNLAWSAWSVAELYRSRWDIEVFFKEIKQTLQLADFLGHNANAVRWQIWIGLLVHLLLRYLAYLHSWPHSFTRLFTILRSTWWSRWHLGELLDRYGTAKPPGRICGTPESAYLPGFA